MRRAIIIIFCLFFVFLLFFVDNELQVMIKNNLGTQNLEFFRQLLRSCCVFFFLLF